MPQRPKRKSQPRNHSGGVRRQVRGDPPPVALNPWKNYTVSTITSDPTVTVHLNPSNTVQAWAIQSGMVIDPTQYEVKFRGVDVYGAIIANSTVTNSGTASLEPYILSQPATANVNARQSYPLMTDQGSPSQRAVVSHRWSRSDQNVAFNGADSADVARLLAGPGGRVLIHIAIRPQFNISAFAERFGMTEEQVFIHRANNGGTLPLSLTSLLDFSFQRTGISTLDDGDEISVRDCEILPPPTADGAIVQVPEGWPAPLL